MLISSAHTRSSDNLQHLTLTVDKSGERFSGDCGAVRGEEVRKACGDARSEVCAVPE
jgi:hypothetical protein